MIKGILFFTLLIIVLTVLYNLFSTQLKKHYAEKYNNFIMKSYNCYSKYLELGSIWQAKTGILYLKNGKKNYQEYYKYAKIVEIIESANKELWVKYEIHCLDEDDSIEIESNSFKEFIKEYTHLV